MKWAKNKDRDKGYHQNKTDHCQFCGDTFGLNVRRIVNGVTSYHPFKADIDEVLQCADCRRILGRQQIGVKKCKEVLIAGYQKMEETEMVRAKLENVGRDKAESIKQDRANFERQRAISNLQAVQKL